MRHHGTTHPLERPVPRQIIAWFTVRVESTWPLCFRDIWCLTVQRTVVMHSLYSQTFPFFDAKTSTMLMIHTLSIVRSVNRRGGDD